MKDPARRPNIGNTIKTLLTTQPSSIKHALEFDLLLTPCCFFQGDVSETVRMFFDDSKSFPPAAKSLLTIQDVDASLTRLAMLTKEDEQQQELEVIAKK